ncbi:MAG: IclR family transcriptional regulator [Burkholderiaceae bacterium]
MESTALTKALGLLEATAGHPGGRSLADLAAEVGMPKPTAHRILNDLVMARMVDRTEPGLYQLGMRLLELGNLVKARLNVRDAAAGPMRDLHKLTGETINLAVRQADEIVYVERAVSERSGMQVVRAIGGRAALHLTSSGKLFLAADDSRAVRSYGMRTGLAGQTRNSITDVPRLERELEEVRRQGFARDNEELELGVRCIAAAIRDDAGRIVAGLSISAPADRANDGWVSALRQTALQISHSLGYEASG